MKKRKLRIVALMLLVALIIPCYANAGDGEAQKDKMLTDEEQYELMLKQAPAMAAYEQLMAAWVNEKTGMMDYPDAFGGFYHTDDFKLAIKVVDNNERFIAEVLEIVGNFSPIRFVNTDISFKELAVLRSNISQNLSNDTAFRIGISQKTSSVCVTLPSGQRGDSKPALKCALLQDPHVEIGYADWSAQMQAISYNPGKMIATGTSLSTSSKKMGTLGWYGTYNFPRSGQMDCFLTAGHVQIAFEREENGAGASMYFGNSKVFSREYYPDGAYGERYCVVVCGDDRTSANYPKGNSLGDYALMACNSNSLPDTDISKSNKIQMNGFTVSITDYFGSDIRNAILNGSFDVDYFNDVRDYCFGTQADPGVLPEGTHVAKGLGMNGNTSAFGRVKWVCANGPYNYYDNGKNPEAYGSTGDIEACIIIQPSNSATDFSVGGDSGSPIYYINGDGQNALLGIISSGGTDSVYGGRYTAITPITILIKKGFVPYVG